MDYTASFTGGKVRYLPNTSFSHIDQLVSPADCIVITDTNIAKWHSEAFDGFKAVITIAPGEENKNFATILSVTQQLLEHEAHRKTFLLGVGGGIVTDITGFVASIYMRGLPFGYAPTSLLGMVDASVGGKNGINLGLQKNLLGTIRQPEFILFDQHFLSTLPDTEWNNGFAEIIKYACLFDEELFKELAESDIQHYQKNIAALTSLVTRCVDWKNKIVAADEYEQGSRKQLNFGHTAGHAIETICKTPHGHAVGLGMLVACKLSEQYGLEPSVTERLFGLLLQYNLPVSIDVNINQLLQVMAQDKKRDNNGIDFILLKAIGKAIIKNIKPEEITPAIEEFNHASSY